MLLILHAGLHKTASTYFQNLLLLNRQALRARGVYVEPDRLLPANHGTAWMALQDDFRHAAAHVREAIAAGCESMILSSEDFEGMIFSPARAAALEAAVRSAGATKIEWHFCLRDPGALFASMFAEFSRHQYVDYLSMLALALRDGRVRVDRPAKRLPAQWDFCFDHARHLTTFAGGIGGDLRLHDFRDGTPYRGHRMISRLAPGFIALLPGDNARNARPAGSKIDANLVEQIDRLAADTGIDADVRAALVAHGEVSPEIRRAGEATLSRNFSPGMEAMLRDWPAL